MLRKLVSKARGAFGSAPAPSTLQSALQDSSLVSSFTYFRSISMGTWYNLQENIATESINPRTQRVITNNPPAPAWTPTRELVKRKTLPKRMGFLMQTLEKEKEEQAQAQLNRPEFGPGDFLELKLSVPENKRRTTTFKGICIAKRNRGWRTSFTLRNFIGSSGGIERTFPLYSPHINEITILPQPNRKKYRRSKLYFLRDRQPKEYRIT